MLSCSVMLSSCKGLSPHFVLPTLRIRRVVRLPGGRLVSNSAAQNEQLEISSATSTPGGVCYLSIVISRLLCVLLPVLQRCLLNSNHVQQVVDGLPRSAPARHGIQIHEEGTIKGLAWLLLGYAALFVGLLLLLVFIS